MTTLAPPSTNEIQNTIAVANSFVRGTDTTITLTDGSAFPNAAHVIRIRNLDNTKWCLLIYTSRAGNVLTMGGGAADYALAKCVTVGDEAYDWPAGSIVELVTAADEIAQIFNTMFRKDGSDALSGALNLTSGQIAFPATAVPSANANTLDDYEEGSWTPDLQFGNAKVGITYDIDGGFYTKIGNQVTVCGRIQLTSKGTSVGAVAIKGLPFNCKNDPAVYCLPVFYLDDVTFANAFMGYIIPNTDELRLEEVTEAGIQSFLANTNFADNSKLWLTITYFVN